MLANYIITSPEVIYGSNFFLILAVAKYLDCSYQKYQITIDKYSLVVAYTYVQFR
jgi:hypothetical protein